MKFLYMEMKAHRSDPGIKETEDRENAFKNEAENEPDDEEVP